MPKLEKNVQYYKDLLDYLSEDLFVIDKDYVVVDINNSMLQSTGHSRSEAVGRFCYEISHGFDEPCSGMDHVCPLKEVFESGRRVKALHQHTSKDGKTLWVEIASSPLKDKEGRVTHVVESIRDVTDLKTLQSGLLQFQKMESLGAQAAGIAHDFNNILTSMIGITEMALLRVPAEDPSREDFESLQDLNNKAVKLVQQILTFSRQQPLELKSVDLNQNVKFMADLFGKNTSRKIEIQVDPAKNLSRAKLDPGQIDQVLLNLLVNSRDAMPGGGTIRISTRNIELDQSFCRAHPGSQPGRYVQISVSDNGHGMDEEVVGKIFEPFFTTKDQGVGTGLGLAVVFGIVKQHKGYIRASSKVGEWTTFDIYLPAIP